MNLNIKIFLLCPIPDDQKPISEYINLKENDFTNLMLLSRKNYFSKIFTNFLIYFVLSTPVTYIFRLNAQLFLFNSFYAISLLILNFFINLLRWSQLLKRFRSTRLFYEEGSWYDGQIWEKPLELIKNDKLLVSQKIRPILKRLIKTLIILLVFNSYIYFSFIVSS
jgi:hypothetical protein|tara:strand:- start:77 stop:574 length:498 start_codon:yes stop_codon:yes gene_type:complete